jgi:hypothetical protein
MTRVEPADTEQLPAPPRKPTETILVSWLTSTDHKVIGHLYLITSFIFFLLAGIMAMVIRAELLEPGMQLVTREQYNQLFTMHGAVMLLLFATPLFAGFANARWSGPPRARLPGTTSPRCRRSAPSARRSTSTIRASPTSLPVPSQIRMNSPVKDTPR